MILSSQRDSITFCSVDEFDIYNRIDCTDDETAIS